MSDTRASFPTGGTSWDALKSEMRERSSNDVDWRNGRTPLFVFQADAETYEVGKKAYFEFFSENALGRTRAFHGLMSMERDVLDYGLALMSAPAGAEAAFTTGGSESIFLAMKAARDRLRAGSNFRIGEDRLNLVMPITAHPGFDKAADAMDIEIRRGAVGEDKRATAESLRHLVDERTIAIVGSAPNFPHGVMDRIDQLSSLAEELGVWLHVDACVGGWLAPWFTEVGRDTPTFDFRHAGVKSISADLHKFGFCPKPASTVFYRHAEDLERAKFSTDAWPCGKFETATIAGTRPGGGVAAAWAVLNHLGSDGYKRIAKQLGAMTDRYVEGIEALGFRMIARPDFSIINFGSDELDMFLVAERLVKRGWLPGLTKEPKGLHAMMSLLHESAMDDYLTDLEWAAAEVRTMSSSTSNLEAVY